MHLVFNITETQRNYLPVVSNVEILASGFEQIEVVLTRVANPNDLQREFIAGRSS